MTREEVQRNFFLTIQRKVKCKLNEFYSTVLKLLPKASLITMVTNSVTVITLRKKWDIA